MKKLLILIYLLTLININSEAQFLSDESSKQTTIKGLNYLYNGDFINAQKQFDVVKAKYSNHPLSNLLEAIYYQNKYFPIEDNPSYHSKYFQALQNCNSKALALAKKDNEGPESTFFLLAAAGYTAQYYNDKNEKMKAGYRGKEAYNYLIRGFNFMQQNPEFYFTSGLYNYYRVQYPISNPVIKPIMVFFKDGNKATGLSQMKKATQSAIFSKVEATFYLMDILLKYESNFKDALYYASILRSKYPNNKNFTIKYIECLLLNDQFQKAKPYIDKLESSSNLLQKVAYYTFKGLTLMNEGNSQAASYLASAIKIKSKNEQVREYHSVAYLELAKDFKNKGDIANAKTFLAQAQNLTDYSWVKKECKKLESELK